MDNQKDSQPHLSREFDRTWGFRGMRTLGQLERLQRMRMGQPVPPPMKLDVSL